VTAGNGVTRACTVAPTADGRPLVADRDDAALVGHRPKEAELHLFGRHPELSPERRVAVREDRDRRVALVQVEGEPPLGVGRGRGEDPVAEVGPRPPQDAGSADAA
jgi:hypothetical protein